VRNRVAAYSRENTGNKPGSATAKWGTKAAPPGATIVLPAGRAVKGLQESAKNQVFIVIVS
jgi:hypothetical protein